MDGCRCWSLTFQKLYIYIAGCCYGYCRCAVSGAEERQRSCRHRLCSDVRLHVPLCLCSTDSRFVASLSVKPLQCLWRDSVASISTLLLSTQCIHQLTNRAAHSLKYVLSSLIVVFHFLGVIRSRIRRVWTKYSYHWVLHVYFCFSCFPGLCWVLDPWGRRRSRDAARSL